MNSVLRPVLALIALLVFTAHSPSFARNPDVAGARPTAARVDYTVALDPAHRTLRVSVRADGVHDPELRVALPAWTPGWYVLTDFEKNVGNVTASASDGRALKVVADGPRAWKVTTLGAKAVVIHYDVLAADTEHGFFGPYLDRTHGYVPGPASLMYVVGGTQAPCAIAYQVPDGWKVASGSDPAPGKPNTFTAPDYDTLADQPADLGNFLRFDRTIAGIPVSIVIVGGRGIDPGRWVDGVFKIAAAGIKLFGGAPFPRYVFHFRFDSSAGFNGGLEHLNGTVIRLDPSELRRADAGGMALVAHEFTHAWNVKRARPVALGPFDYTRPVRVKDLWFCEGVTDYMAPRIVVEAGLAGRDFWLGYMGAQLSELQENPARHQVTLEETSLRVWESGTSEGVGGLSYYNKGLLVGLLLDIQMRRASHGKVGVEDLIKTLVARAKTSGKGYADGEIEKTASQLAGADLSAFFATALRTTDELPFEKILPDAGITVEAQTRTLPTLGIQWDFAGSRAGEVKVAAVVPGGPAQKAGLQPGDIITAADGAPLDQLLGPAFAEKQPGDTIAFVVVRANRARTVNVTVGAADESTYRLHFSDSPGADERAIRTAITGS